MREDGIGALLARIAERIGAAEITYFATGDRGDGWEIRPLDGAEPSMLLLRGARPGHMLLVTDVGPPPAADREAALEALLLYNALGTDTGGARFALDEPGGAVTLAIDVGEADLAEDALARMMAGLRTLASGWRRVLAGWGADAAADAPDPGMTILRG
jgi:hypothetical protein